MKDSVIDHRGHPLAVAPLERHEFVGNEFLCSVCKRPHALHINDGFKPKIAPLPVDSFPIRTGWSTRPPVGRLLTDKDIDKYSKQGWYSEQFREARRERWSKSKRKGNFVESDGRLIYSPI